MTYGPYIASKNAPAWRRTCRCGAVDWPHRMNSVAGCEGEPDDRDPSIRDDMADERFALAAREARSENNGR